MKYWLSVAGNIRIRLISNWNMRLDIYNYWSTLKDFFLTCTKFEWHLASFWLFTFDKEIMALKYCLRRAILESQHDSSNHIKILWSHRNKIACVSRKRFPRHDSGNVMQCHIYDPICKKYLILKLWQKYIKCYNVIPSKTWT